MNQTETQYQEDISFSHFAGFDWARDHHDVIIVDDDGKIVADFRIDHSTSGWNLWQERVEGYPKLALAIETNQGAAVDQLIASGTTIFPINPLNAKRYRERKCSSGNKTDRHDAWALADALRLDRRQWRALEPEEPAIAELRLLCRDEVSLIEERTALINSLKQCLHDYYPTALEAFTKWTLPSAWAFVARFPTPEKLTRSGRRNWENWLHANKLARPTTFEKRLAIFEQAGEWEQNEVACRAKSQLALARVRQLQAVEKELAIYRTRIRELFASHADKEIFDSLPGAGPKLAPRLLSELGSNRARFQDAKGLQCIAGTAPISYQSGQIHKVRLRHGCNKHLRATMHHFANLSRTQCSWAATYYRGLRDRGKSHAQSIRSLGQRWLKIIWKIWQTNSCYDDDVHRANQIKHGSWVVAAA